MSNVKKKDNDQQNKKAVMLTVIRMIKEDLVWPNDFATPFELQAALDNTLLTKLRIGILLS